MIKVDARGLDCPQPVIKTKDAINKGEKVETLVDNKTACKNLQKLGDKMNCNVEVMEVDDDFQLTFIPEEELVTSSTTSEELDDTGDSGGKVYFISSDVVGEGDQELGEILIKGFTYTLTEIAPKPKAIVFMNDGVKLPTLNDEVIDNLKILEEAGIEIISCGTCLDYYGLKDELAVGEVSNMYTIVETLNNNPVVTV
ncbi:sulfurtransferase-like selenium metabolism protein YedF [Acetohalobium arabaticum]|uniref:Selenium metabolism protein YedF n=1 Tax=Acetohalobium arabaticum (strain ATCC 49924 / DSM 5501 / Z-7288) TaxID=574087 RepID=D9QUA2_ACEAZ|nr:sulfurtransferase-like selenium metabolism protein YedF [Acetohalobium arabaticum]ADL11895.1 selenium metabolism protein YedF [Acetohalobium arabaticum DSM 5501]